MRYTRGLRSKERELDLEREREKQFVNSVDARRLSSTMKTARNEGQGIELEKKTLDIQKKIRRKWTP